VAHVVGDVAANPDRHVYATYELAGPERLSSTEWPNDLAMFATYDRAGYPASANVLRLLLGREPTPLATVAQREPPNG
jgi:hypothetical protein